MKKVLALVLALTMVMGLGLVANADAGCVTADEFDMIASDGTTFQSLAEGTAKNGASFKPGKEYTFVIAPTSASGVVADITDDNTDNAVGITGAEDFYKAVNGGKGIAKQYDIKIEWNQGKDLFEKFEVVKGLDEMKLVVKAKDSYSVKENKFSVKITLRDKDRKLSNDAEVVVKEGKIAYKQVDMDYYVDLEDGIVLITKDKGVYEDAEIVAGNYAKYVVTTDSQQANQYVGYTTKAIQEAIDANPSIDMNFVSFPGKPSFNRLGKMYLYAEKDQFIYEVKDGKAVAVKADYDEDEEAYVFNTRTLGSYIIADKELKNFTISEGGSSSNTTNGGKDNPGTGSNDVVNVAVAMALVSLAAAGAVAFKKASK